MNNCMVVQTIKKQFWKVLTLICRWHVAHIEWFDAPNDAKLESSSHSPKMHLGTTETLKIVYIHSFTYKSRWNDSQPSKNDRYFQKKIY